MEVTREKLLELQQELRTAMESLKLSNEALSA
jgi:hypothetical protein